MATAAATRDKVKEYTFLWEGKDKAGKIVKGDMRAGGEHVVLSQLRRQGIAVLKVKRQRGGVGGKVTQKDITLFTRQLATMMKAGVPSLARDTRTRQWANCSWTSRTRSKRAIA